MTHRLAFPHALMTFLLAAVLAGAAISAGGAVTPPPVREHAREDQFEAHGARERLARILGDERAHPVDSDAQDAVRDRVLREIEALGFAPQIDDRFVCQGLAWAPAAECARVRNISFSIGPREGPSVLALAHYDSVPASPGASDDGIGVAVWLEAARVLADVALQRRVDFVFTDGEEQALLGAAALAESASMQSAQALVNLEARGSRGPAVFFETNAPNADAVRAYAAAGRPVANSIMAEAYRLLPNSTDVSVLTRPGLDVVNIAILDGVEDYHTPQDSLASQDLRSVQHMGDVALASVRRLAGAPDAGSATEMSYTDIASRAFVYVPEWSALAALWASLFVCGAAFWRAGTRMRLHALVSPALCVVAAGGLAFAAHVAVSMLRPGEDYAFAHPEWTRALAVLLALFALALAAMLLRARSPEQAGAAGMLWFAAIGASASIMVSGASILFALPASLFAVAWLVSLAWPPAARIGAWLAALLTLLVWAPMLYLVEVALGLGMPFALAALVALMLLPWWGPLAQTQHKARWRWLVAATGAASLLVGIAAASAPAMSETRPRPLNLSYLFDLHDGRAHILAGSAERALPGELRADFSPRVALPGDEHEMWAAPAAAEPIPAPALARVEVAAGRDARVVRGRLEMNGAYRATLRIPMSERPLRASINGAVVELAAFEGEQAQQFAHIACQGRACDGAAVEIVLGRNAGPEADWFVVGQTPDLRVGAAEATRARRPPATTPIQFGDSAISLRRLRPQS